MPRNPYPTRPGFGLRFARALRVLSNYGLGWSEEECGVYTRTMDNCFENGDGDAVVWALMNRAMTDPTLETGIRRMGEKVWPHWLSIYQKHDGPKLPLEGAA